MLLSISELGLAGHVGLPKFYGVFANSACPVRIFCLARAGLSQEKLALEAGVDRTLVSKIERKIANPSIEILLKLAFALKVPVVTLMK